MPQGQGETPDRNGLTSKPHRRLVAVKPVGGGRDRSLLLTLDVVPAAAGPDIMKPRVPFQQVE